VLQEDKHGSILLFWERERAVFVLLELQMIIIIMYIG
jgi:hypothetical protein